MQINYSKVLNREMVVPKIQNKKKIYSNVPVSCPVPAGFAPVFLTKLALS